jgi:hypothetical protein
VRLPLTKEQGRVLDFDIENMPLTYYAPDYPTAYITAIAWAFTDDPKNIQVRAITNPSDDGQYSDMLADFWGAYEEAEVVTGHYIRKHDLPIINGALIESGFMHGLQPKLASDTKMDLVKFTAIPKNQEFLEAILGTSQQKEQMTQADWRAANRFTKAGVERTIKRVTTDVRGHMQVRKELIERGLLKAPRLWRP